MKHISKDFIPDRRSVLKGGAALTASVIIAPQLLGRARAATQGHLNFGLSSYPPTLEPWKNAGTASSTVKLQIFRGLLGYDEQGGLRSEIAEKWEAEDPQTYRFDLRKNAKFHDGTPVTSADVKFSYESIIGEKSTAYLRVAMGIIDKIETPDDHTVRIRLKSPSASFIFLVASFYTFIISAKSMADDPKKPMGAGPYTITKIERGTRIDLKAFPDFYKAGLPKSKTLSFVAYKDQSLRVAALEAGDVDIIEYVPWQSMDSVDKNPNLTLENTDGPFMYLLFNTTKGPLSKPKVRDAIGYAIKREDVMAAAFFGRGRPLYGMPVPENSPYFHKELSQHWSYDPAKAKALLAEAGHGDGFNATMLSTAQYGMHKNTAEVCQQHLIAVGINVKLNLPDWATRVDLGNRGQYDIAVMGTAGQYNDPDALTNFVDGRRGASFVRSHGFSDDKLNDLMDRGRAEIDPVKRKAIYDEWNARAIETVPIVGINWRAQGYGFQKGVSGFANIPGFLTFYSGSTIETAQTN
jgi:peptide/nickel transport system substrate-binding protein